MSKLKLLLLFVVFVGTSGYLIKIPTTSWTPKTDPVENDDWVYKQKLIMPLFENVCEDSTDPVIVNLSNEFETDFGSGNYVMPEVINNAQSYRTGKGLLPKGEIFTEYNKDHVEELKVVFDILYFSKDFETFYKSAAWARQNINCGLYVDAIYLALLNRKDTENLSIPPLYELLPNYFIHKDVIIKGSLLLANEQFIESENVRVQGNSYILDANYTEGSYENYDKLLSYFHEDISMNSFYFLQKLKMSPWLNDSIGLSPKYGVKIYHIMKQFMTRYNLERYAHGLPELEDFNWNSLSMIAYNPLLIYSNGKDFDQSTLMISLDNPDITLLQNIENNVVQVANHMRENGYNKDEILNHLIEILVTNNNSYENLAFKILGNDNTSRSPSVLAHYLTTVRDPLFWRINKKIVDLLDGVLNILPGYTRNDIIFPGVEIVNVDIKKMVTSFDYFEFDVTDALKTTTSNPKFQVKIGQYRINHKPFSFKLNISSLVAQKGFAKIFIGPKILPGELSEKKNLFFLLDCFELNLKKGKNIITRTSDEMKLSEDLTSLKVIKKRLEDAEFGLNVLPIKELDSQTAYPLRLVLPKGTENGLPLQIFVFIAPYVKPVTGGRSTNIQYNMDAIFTPGYPLDLNNDIHQILDLPNAIIKDVTITHKDENKPMKESSYDTADAKTSNIWTSNEIEKPIGTLKLSARPDFTIGKEPFDYKSKRGQYGKKEDYLTKRGDYSKNRPDIFKEPTTNNYTDVTNNKDEGSMENKIEEDFSKNFDDLNKSIYHLNTDETVYQKTTKKPQDNNNIQEPITTGLNQKDDLRENKVTENVKPTLSKKRNPTVYDFLFDNPFDNYDVLEEKIYE